MQKDALKDLSSAIDLNEDYVKALLKRSEVNLALQNFEEAVKDLERVKQIEPTTPGIK